MQSDFLSDINIAKAAAGVAGSFVSLSFIDGTRKQKLFLATGGALMSYFFSTQVAIYFNMQNAEGVIGFLIGMFGMAISAKIYEVIKAADAKELSGDMWAWLKRKWGA